MARGRMIDNCISISEKINDLTLREAFIYTWIIPHLDDWGRISGSPRTLKALVFPMKKEISISNIENALSRFKEMGLFLWESIDDELVLQQFFEEFNNHQSISDSKRAKSKYPEILEASQEMPRNAKNPQENPAQVNLIKEKLIKDKNIYAEFVSMTLEEYQKLTDKYGDSNTKRFIDKLNVAKGAKGYKYKSDYLAILNWVVEAVLGTDKKKELEDHYRLAIQKEKEWEKEKKETTATPVSPEIHNKIKNIFKDLPYKS